MRRATVKWLQPIPAANGKVEMHLRSVDIPFEGEKPKHFRAFAKKVVTEGFSYSGSREILIAPGMVVTVEEKKA